jgi:serine/threonine protein kinase
MRLCNRQLRSDCQLRRRWDARLSGGSRVSCRRNMLHADQPMFGTMRWREPDGQLRRVGSMHRRLPRRANVLQHHVRRRMCCRRREMPKPIGLLLGSVRQRQPVDWLWHLREHVRRLGWNMHCSDRRVLLPAYVPATYLANRAPRYMSVVEHSAAPAGRETSPEIRVATGRRRHEVKQVSTVMSPLDVGDVVAGKYRLIRLLGRGSMGEVWLAHHQTLHENVAIKLLARTLTAATTEDASRAATRLQFEAQVAARLCRRTRHIVQVTDHGDADGLAYLVMEPLEGMTLEGRLMLCEWLPLSTVQVIVRQVARALEHAHAERVLHRDLKPSNLFLTKDEEGELLVKVLDFGIARAIHRESSMASFSTGPGVVCGTPGYLSPEQARGQAWLDARCDLWALATIAYEALTNELPVGGCTPDELYKSAWMGATVPIAQRRSDLPRAVEVFFERAFAQDIAQRFATAQELVRGFDDACASDAQAEPISSTLVSHTLPSRRSPQASTRPEKRGGSAHPRRRARLLMALSLLPLVAALAAGIGRRSSAHLDSRQERRPTPSAPTLDTPEPSEQPDPVASSPPAVATAETGGLTSSPETHPPPGTAPLDSRVSKSPLPLVRPDRRAPNPTGGPMPSAAPAQVVRDRSDVL